MWDKRGLSLAFDVADGRNARHNLGRMKAQQPAWIALLLNHVDAWVVTLVLGAAAIWLHDAFSWQNAYLVVALTAAYWLAFAFNDYCDAAFDGLDPLKGPRNYFVGRDVSRPLRWGATLVVGGMTLPGVCSLWGDGN